MNQYDVPVALYVFRRTETVKLILEVLQDIKPAVLYVFADGPRNEEEKLKTDSVRALVDEMVDWPCDFKREYSEVNLSCSPNITRGYTKVLTDYPYAVFLEDDAVPKKEFFIYCEQLLKKYENDKRIQYIAGFNATADPGLMSTSYDFGTCVPMSGAIGLFRDGWMDSEKDCSRWPELKKRKDFKKNFPNKEYGRIYSGLFEEMCKKGWGEWDVQLNFDQYLNHKCAVVPRINLVRSYGYTEGAFHEQESHEAERLKRLMDYSEEEFTFPMKEPSYDINSDIVINRKYDKKRQELFVAVKGGYIERHLLYFKRGLKDIAYKYMPRALWDKLKGVVKK